MKVFVFAVLVFLIGQCLAELVRYDNHSLYRITAKTPQALKQLKDLENVSREIQFWNEVRSINLPVDVLIPPQHVDEMEELFKGIESDFVLLNPNIQEVIEAESLSTKSSGFGWTSYHTLQEINDWLESLASEYPDKVQLITVGRSYEGRDINGVKVKFNENNENNAVFLESNIHAREWISSAVVTYILNELLTSTDPKVRSVAESHDWYIVPVFNVDGFEYTKTKDRLWRKTRVPYGGKCFGADPNRNWGYHWNEGGSSSDPCSDVYNGPYAFSEPSTKSISQYIDSIGSKLVAYIGFHSYSQLLLIPYGYSSAHLDNYDQLEEIGLKAAKSLAQKYGTKYTVGNIVETIYIASGGSVDWVKGMYQTPITYTYELRDTGKYGFLLPADQIIPTAEETLDSLITIFEEYGKKSTCD